MKLTIHTERGSFSSSEQELDEAGLKSLRESVKSAVSGAEMVELHFSGGFLVIPGELVRRAVFVFD